MLQNGQSAPNDSNLQEANATEHEVLSSAAVEMTLQQVQAMLPPGLTEITTNNWVAPCKPAPNDYFVAILQVAPNQLKFGMSTLFVLKYVPVVFFFKNAETYGQNCVKFNPPPSLFVSKQRRISIFEGQNTVHVSFTLLEGDWGGGGVREGRGGVNFQECVWRKTQENFLTQKE